MLLFGRCCCLQTTAPNEKVIFPTSVGLETSTISQLAAAQAAQAQSGNQQGSSSIMTAADVGSVDISSSEPRRRLQVPPDFSIRSVNSDATDSNYVSLSEEQKAREMQKLQNMIRDFVMEFVQGVYLDAVLENGSLVPCRCTMDSKLSVLMLQVHTTTRQINLRNIQEICSGKELRDLRVTTPLDDLCVTLVMADDQCVSFKFSDVQGREHFATCMKVLRLALD